MSLIETIQKFIQNDAQLARLFERVREYAELYLIAKQRQKGCDGMGEVATFKDELIYLMNEMIRYCNEKGYFSGDVPYDVDLIAHDICETKPE
ncbi:MAG: hypothetical protein V1764_06460 [Nitrospirota bacterium]